MLLVLLVKSQLLHFKVLSPYHIKAYYTICFIMAPRAGFEPTIAESKSAVLPLHYQGTETSNC